MEKNRIDVHAQLLKLWAKKRVFLAVWIVTAVVAYGLTYLLPVRWQAKTEFVEDYNIQEWQDIQVLIRNGVFETTGSPSGSIYGPKLFPTIVGSATFLEQLMEKPLQSANGQTVREVMLRRDTLQSRAKQIEIVRKMVSCAKNMSTLSVAIKVTAYEPSHAEEIATLAREQLAEFIATNRRANRLRNLQSYELNREESPTAQMLYEIARAKLDREEPVFAVIREAEVPFRPKSPRRLYITAIALLLMTLGLTIWYWRKDIPQWL